MTQREEIDELRARVDELEGEKRAAIELWDHVFRACDDWPGGCGPGKRQWKEFVASFEPDKSGYRDIVLAVHVKLPGVYTVHDAIPTATEALGRFGWSAAVLDMAPLDLTTLPMTDTSREAILGRYFVRANGPEVVAAFEASERRRQRSGIG